MAWVKKNFIYLLAIIMLLGVYGTVAYCYLFRNDMSIEYDYFYREQKTKFWAGDGSLLLNPYGSGMTFASENDYKTYAVKDLNLQYIGKSTDLQVEEETNILQNLYAKKNFDFYYCLDLEQCEEGYQIAIEYFSTNLVKLFVNDKEYDIEHCMIAKEDLKEVNHLVIKGSNITIYRIAFE